MTSEAEIKQRVREFYDQVGWQVVGDGLYQNARYEDLRPVSRDYIHRCHLRVGRHLEPAGALLLDAGSGPIQYPEYLTYSEGYRRRVCADISIQALREARQRIGEHGLFVVADLAHLPFRAGSFDGAVSLHTIHHLPQEQHLSAYQELYRVLAPGRPAVVVNGWADSPFKGGIKRAVRLVNELRSRKPEDANGEPSANSAPAGPPAPRQGTFVAKGDAAWLKGQVAALMPLQILVWRSVNTRFLRTFIHARLGGRRLLQVLFWLEERFPRFFGEKGVYPLIVIRKPEEG